MLVLDEVLWLQLSNFSRQLKLKPGIDDDQRVIVAMSNNLWFRGLEVKEEGERRIKLWFQCSSGGNGSEN